MKKMIHMIAEQGDASKNLGKKMVNVDNKTNKTQESMEKMEERKLKKTKKVLERWLYPPIKI